METYTLDAEAGAVSAELAKLGIEGHTRVHVVVSVYFEQAALAEHGRAFDWLADEPELYSDADLTERAR